MYCTHTRVYISKGMRHIGLDVLPPPDVYNMSRDDFIFGRCEYGPSVCTHMYIEDEKSQIRTITHTCTHTHIADPHMHTCTHARSTLPFSSLTHTHTHIAGPERARVALSPSALRYTALTASYTQNVADSIGRNKNTDAAAVQAHPVPYIAFA
jgi:hypothetical protein